MSVQNAQFDALEAQVDLLKVMIAAMRHTANAPRAVAPPLPPRCQQEPAETCANQSGEGRLEMGGMGGGPQTVMCRGCGEQTTK